MLANDDHSTLSILIHVGREYELEVLPPHTKVRLDVEKRLMELS